MTMHLSNNRIRPPCLSGVVARPRLFDEIDALRGSGCRLVWLSGAPGSGKTSLAAGYVEHCHARVVWLRTEATDADPATLFGHLAAATRHAGGVDDLRLPAIAPLHLSDAARYGRLFFRAVFEAIADPCIIVFDDAHAFTAGAAGQQIVEVLVEELPEGWLVLAAARHPAPDALARHRVNGTAGEIGGSALAFTIEETRELLGAHRGRPGDAEALHASTGGWAAALALRARPRLAAAPGACERDADRQLAAYLDSEVFELLAEEDRRGLLALAWLPVVRRGWPARLGVAPSAERAFESMAGNGILVQTWGGEGDDVEYRFHPLFADFLRERSRSACTGTQKLAQQRAAVALLESSDMPEAALELALETQAWSTACELVARLAPQALAAARQRTVVAWADAIPEHHRSPWLRFWLGQAQMVGNPARGRENVRKAYEAFSQHPDPAPRYQALAAILSTYSFEYSTLAPMSRWLAEFHTLGMEYEALTDDHVKAVAAVGVWSGLCIREPQHPDLALWESRMQAMLALDVDPNVKLRGAMLLAKHHWYTGQHPRIWSLPEQVAGELDKPGVLPDSRLAWHLLQIYDAWARADLPAGGRAADAALELAQRSGIRVIDCHLTLHAACFALVRGDADADRLIDRAAAMHKPARRIETWHLFACRTWQALLDRKFTRAIEHAAITLDAAEPIGPPPQCTALVGMCYAMLGVGDAQALAPRLQRLRQLAESSCNPFGVFHARLIEARKAQLAGRVDECHARLREGFAIGREQHLHGFVFALPEVLSHLCGEALTAGIEPAYARELIRRQQLRPPPSPSLRDAWPWRLRIHTLGRFVVHHDDRPIASTGKAQKKTLELLKALLAFGGCEVDASELADRLWPASDGDAARSALDMSVHRLRKLLGHDDALVMHDGKLSINGDVCWVDVWAFERGLEASPSCESVIALYRGAFLANESEQPWLLPARERWRQRYLRAVLELGEKAEAKGRWDEAVAIYERGLEHDGLAEALYRRLMLCHLQRSDHAATVQTYRRCYDLLSVMLGVRPSPATETVYRSLPRPDLSRRDPSLPRAGERWLQ